MFDAANGVWYIVEGDWTNFGWSAIAFIPIGGDIFQVGRMGIKYLDDIGAVNRLIKSAKNAGKQLFTKGAGKSPNKVTDLAKDMKDWLGKDAKVITNKNGDKVFISSDGTRRIRFDINNTSPHNNPHGHVEQLVNGKWVKSGPLYPKDVPHN